ncbi:unnamed protein product [Protopolystoma xenopodis]|uniref:Uncharacterized protein n=1 Tax=Protopolystoma xenopodis TaxID=117903 RepID=A0A3S5BKU9_9PLAT|nr:unnamed protein product [Protopolystoma xenopodis]
MSRLLSLVHQIENDQYLRLAGTDSHTNNPSYRAQFPFTRGRLDHLVASVTCLPPPTPHLPPSPLHTSLSRPQRPRASEFSAYFRGLDRGSSAL